MSVTIATLIFFFAELLEPPPLLELSSEPQAADAAAVLRPGSLLGGRAGPAPPLGPGARAAGRDAREPDREQGDEHPADQGVLHVLPPQGAGSGPGSLDQSEQPPPHVLLDE